MSDDDEIDSFNHERFVTDYLRADLEDDDTFNLFLQETYANVSSFGRLDRDSFNYVYSAFGLGIRLSIRTFWVNRLS